jgi:hypothetical protein
LGAAALSLSVLAFALSWLKTRQLAMRRVTAKLADDDGGVSPRLAIKDEDFGQSVTQLDFSITVGSPLQLVDKDYFALSPQTHKGVGLDEFNLLALAKAASVSSAVKGAAGASVIIVSPRGAATSPRLSLTKDFNRAIL